MGVVASAVSTLHLSGTEALDGEGLSVMNSVLKSKRVNYSKDLSHYKRTSRRILV